MMKANNIKNRVGERKVMKCGEECEVVEYRKYSDVTVRFLNTDELVKCTYSNFKIGNIKSHFTPTVYGVGIVGLEKMTEGNGKHLKSYKVWADMLRRCYSQKYQEKYPTYIDCKVCKEWLYYPNFKEWYNENYYEVDNEKMCLDKDILFKNNKVYSPETCVFVPHDINSLFVKNNASRGNLPIGVHWKKKNQKYEVRCSLFDIQTQKYKRVEYLGLYKSIEEAFNSYKQFKEENIRQVAEYYKDRIPEKLYEAMYRYEVSIDD